MPDAYKKGTTALIMERQFRVYYEVDPNLPTGKIVIEIGMEQKKAKAINALSQAEEPMQNIQHNLGVANTGSLMLHTQQNDAPDANAVSASVDQLIQNLSAEISSLMQQAQQLNKTVMTAFDYKQIKAVIEAKGDKIKITLAKAMEDNLVRQQNAVEISLGKYEASMKSVYENSIKVAKNVNHTVQTATGQSIPEPAIPSATPVR